MTHLVRRCLILMGLSLLAPGLSGCASSGRGNPASISEAVSTLKTSSRFTDRRDTGYWLRDQVATKGQPLTFQSPEEMALLKALCDWAIHDVRPTAAGKAAPEAFTDHEFLARNLRDRLGLAIALETGTSMRQGTHRSEAFRFYYDPASRDAHAIQPAEVARVKTLLDLGQLTRFEQSTIQGSRNQDIVFVQFRAGLGTEHHIWLLDNGEWKWLHQVGAWVG